MTSKFAIKSILAVSSVFMLGVISTTANAVLYPQSTSQTTCTLAMRAAKLCSIEVEGILKGLGNVTNTPTLYSATILIKKGQVVFQNPAGKSSQANGVPFANVLVTLQGTDLIEAAQITKNGRAISAIQFHDDDLVGAIIAALEAQCSAGVTAACDTLEDIGSESGQHPNWIKWAVLTELDVLGQQWVDESQSCDLSGGNVANCTLEDALGQKCVAPNAVQANPQNFVGQQFDYQCTEACHNKTGTICPTSFPLP